MRTMNITEFKAQALKVLSEVAERRESVIVTKRGRPVAEVVPYTDPQPGADSLADTLVFEKNIVSPLGSDDWEAAQ